MSGVRQGTVNRVFGSPKALGGGWMSKAVPNLWASTCDPHGGPRLKDTVLYEGSEAQ